MRNQVWANSEHVIRQKLNRPADRHQLSSHDSAIRLQSLHEEQIVLLHQVPSGYNNSGSHLFRVVSREGVSWLRLKLKSSVIV
jgi:hypothetical protein